MTTQRLDFSSDVNWPPKVDFDLKKLRYDVAVEILETLWPKHRHDKRHDLSLLGSLCKVKFGAAGFKADDIKEQTLAVMRTLEAANFVRNDGGDWHLTATGAIWVLVARTAPSGWATESALLHHIELATFPAAEIAWAVESCPYFHIRKGSLFDDKVFDLQAYQQPLDGWNGWR
ncbi:hypothetical protein Ccr5_gp263 [Caulobacter phage Ccr5]|nr:hypothetical protein Ccr5_gp263 [Caulobacter phage Ccr5]